MVKTYGQTPAQLFRAAHPLPIQNFGVTNPTNIPPVIEGVEGNSCQTQRDIFSIKLLLFFF